MLKRPKGCAGLQAEDVLVIDLSGGLEGCSKMQMPSQNGQCARTQLHAAVFARLGLVPIDAGDSGFVDADDSVRQIDVREHEGDLLGRSEPSEKAKLIVVALGLTPLVMDRGDERLGVVHGEGIHFWPVRFAKTRTSKVEGRVFMEWPVAIAEVEGALQDADRVVVSLLTPVMPVCDSDQARVTDLRENKLTEMGAPKAVEDLSIRSDRCRRHIVSSKACLAMSEVCIENVITQSST